MGVMYNDDDEVILCYDSEPEDAWVPTDPTDVLLDNLSRRCTILGAAANAFEASPMERLQDIRLRVGRIRRRHLSDDERHRVDLINEDIEFLLGRLEEVADG